MLFHVRITMSDIDSKTSRAPLGIGDTILIDKDGKVNIITSAIQRNYNEISYSLAV